MISNFFIDRPLFATVVSAFIVIAGLAAFRELPVAMYPNVAPPQISVTTVYPGASAEVIAETVAAPLEQALNGVEDMLYMLSGNSSTASSLTIAMTFAVGTDPDIALINVQNRVQSAIQLLPEEVRRQGVSIQKALPSFLMILSFDSPDGRYDDLFVSNYATLNVIDELRRIPGMGNVQVFGARDYSIRIWLQPDRLTELGLTPADVADAVREQNAQSAAGRLGEEPILERVDLTLSVTTQSRLSDPEEFERIVLRVGDDGQVVRLKDVARVELGARDYGFALSRLGRPVIGAALQLAPDANALESAAAVYAKMAELEQGFPEGLAWSIPYDTSKYVRTSMREVALTFVEALVLVFFVVWVFLYNLRATIIPSVAVPVSLVGTFAGMYLLGFSINSLTLFGMVLAIGIVVDDAIVVLENVERHMRDEHVSARDATRRAMAEVSRPVIAIVLVLNAVFLPVAFLGGLVGEMYRQFAITIAVSVTISGFVALTLTPAMCAKLLQTGEVEPSGLLARFDAGFLKLTRAYTAGVRWTMRHAYVAAAAMLLMVAAIVWLERSVPSALAPNEDQGYVLVLAGLPPAASMQRTKAALDAGRPGGVRASGVLRQHHGHGLRRADGGATQQRRRELRAAQGLVGAPRARARGGRRGGRSDGSRGGDPGRVRLLAVAARGRRHVERGRLGGLRAVTLERLRGARASDADADCRGGRAPRVQERRRQLQRRHDVLGAGAARQCRDRHRESQVAAREPR